MREITSRELRNIINEEVELLSVKNRDDESSLNEFVWAPIVAGIVLPMVGSTAGSSIGTMLSDYPELEEKLAVAGSSLQSAANELAEEMTRMAVVLHAIEIEQQSGDLSQQAAMDSVFTGSQNESFLTAALLNKLIQEEHSIFLEDLSSGKIQLNEALPLAALGLTKGVLWLTAAATAASAGGAYLGTKGLEDMLERTIQQVESFCEALIQLVDRVTASNEKIKNFVGSNNYDSIMADVVVAWDAQGLQNEAKHVGIDELTSMIMNEWANVELENLITELGVGGIIPTNTLGSITPPGVQGRIGGVPLAQVCSGIPGCAGMKVVGGSTASGWNVAPVNSAGRVIGTGTIPVTGNAARMISSTNAMAARSLPTVSAPTAPVGTPPGTATPPGAAPQRVTPNPRTGFKPGTGAGVLRPDLTQVGGGLQPKNLPTVQLNPTNSAGIGGRIRAVFSRFNMGGLSRLMGGGANVPSGLNAGGVFSKALGPLSVAFFAFAAFSAAPKESEREQAARNAEGQIQEDIQEMTADIVKYEREVNQRITAKEKNRFIQALRMAVGA